MEKADNMAEKQEILQALRAIQRHAMPNTAKFLLLLLALHGEWRNGGIERIFPGEQLLAKQAGYHETTIRRWLIWLKKEEYLVPDGRKSNSRYSHVEQYIIFDNRFAPDYQKGEVMEEEKPRKSLEKRPRGRPRKYELEPTEAPEPPLPVVYRGDPAPELVAQQQPPDVPAPPDVEQLRERRAVIMAIIDRVNHKERYAVDYWRGYGEARLEELADINQIIGLDVEMEVPVG